MPQVATTDSGPKTPAQRGARDSRATVPDPTHLARFDTLCRTWLARHSPSLAAFRGPQIEDFRAWCAEHGRDPFDLTKDDLASYRDERGAALATLDAFYWFVEQSENGIETRGDFVSPFRRRP